MTTTFRLTAVALMASLLVACGGGATTTVDPNGTPAPTDAAPTDAAPTEGVPGVGELPSFDPAAILQNLDGVDSYRITMSTDGEVGYSAIVVTRPDLSRDITMGTGDDAQRFIVIGDEAWMEEDGTFAPMPAAMVGGMLGLLDPMLMAGGFAQAGAWNGADDQGTEERNGVQARHYQIDSSSFGGAMASLPPGASIDAWVAEDGGYLIALEILGEGGKGIAIDVSGINDPANKVERPG